MDSLISGCDLANQLQNHLNFLKYQSFSMRHLKYVLSKPVHAREVERYRSN